jgi:hypothetical protein
MPNAGVGAVIAGAELTQGTRVRCRVACQGSSSVVTQKCGVMGSRFAS